MGYLKRFFERSSDPNYLIRKSRAKPNQLILPASSLNWLKSWIALMILITPLLAVPLPRRLLHALPVTCKERETKSSSRGENNGRSYQRSQG